MASFQTGTRSQFSCGILHTPLAFVVPLNSVTTPKTQPRLAQRLKATFALATGAPVPVSITCRSTVGGGFFLQLAKTTRIRNNFLIILYLMKLFFRSLCIVSPALWAHVTLA